MLPATQACCVAVASLFSKHTNVSGGEGGEGGGGGRGRGTATGNDRHI